MFQLKLAAGVLVGVGVLIGVQKANHAINYVPGKASIVSVESECHLERRDFYLVARRTQKTGDLPCAEAEEALASDPAFDGFSVEGDIIVTYNYLSPLDQNTHQGTLRYGYDDYKPLAAAGAGTELPIRTHKSDPTASVWDYGNMAAFETPTA